MTTHRETLEAATMGELLPRIMELTQAAVERGDGYHVHAPVKLPDGRRRVEVATWREDRDDDE